jgi:hypothetical protein
VNDALQFEQAEYTADQPMKCGSCDQAIVHVYHELNGQIFCDRCRRNVEISVNSGSRVGRAMRAIMAGTGTAIGCALLYLAFTMITGYEFALLTIFIGYGVGRAVRWGSNGRGGWAYQTLAIVLTYLAIVTSYAPGVLAGLKGDPKTETTAAAATTPPAPSEAGRPSVGTLALGVAVLAIIVCAAPFLIGIKNVIGLFIIGVGLYEAWKTNRRLALNFSGPHRIRPPAAPVQEPAPMPAA